MRFKKAFTAAALAVSMLLQTVPAFAGTDSAGAEVSGWTFYNQNKCDVTYEIVNDEAYTGENSFHIVNRTAGSDSRYFRLHTEPYFPKAGKYKMGCSIKTNNAGLTRMFLGSFMPSLVPYAKTSDWKRYEFTVERSKAGIDWVGIIVYGSCDDIWIDEVFLYETDDDGNAIGENLISNPSFELNAPAANTTLDGDDDSYYYYDDDLSTVNGYLSRAKDIPVSYKNGITVDGTLSDWADVEPIHVSGYQNFIKSAAMENDATIRYAYDDNNFYFCVEVTDPVHYASGTYWQCDSIQAMLSDSPGKFGAELGVMLYDNGDIYNTHEKINVKTTREGDKTYYEVGIPWGTEIPSKPSDFSFNIIVNNNDGDGREYCLEIAPGISLFKSGSYAPILHFVPEGQTGYTLISGKNTANLYEKAEYELAILNWGESKNYSVEIPDAGIKKQVKSAANSVEVIPFEKVLDKIGETKITALINGETEVSCATNAVPDRAGFNGILKEFDEKLARIDSLRKNCEAKGIETEYEKSDAAICERVVEVLQKKYDEGAMDIVIYNINAVEKILDKAISNLNAYLDGNKAEKVTTNYVTSPISFKGESFYAQAETDGVVEERPVFFMSYNHGWEERDETANWADFGINHCSPEGGFYFSDFIGEPDWPVSWAINPAGKGYADADITVVEGAGVNGSNALKIVNRSSESTDGRSSYLWQFVDVKPNTTYHYGYKARGKGIGYFGVAVDWWQTVSGDISNWKSVDYTFTTGDSPNFPTIMLSFGKEKIDELYIDDVYFYEGDSKENLIDNPNFEDYYKQLDGTTFGFNYSRLEVLKNSLMRNEYNNNSVMVSFTLHSVPRVLSGDERYTGGSGGYLPYDVTNEWTLAAIDKLFEMVLPVVEESESAFIMEIHNEPAINAKYAKVYEPDWQEYLVNKYGTIENLNDFYDAEYASFEDVKMPIEISDDLLYYDYRVFNEGLMETYMQRVYDISKKYAPNLLITEKYMIDLCSTENNMIGIRGTERGMNYDRLYKSSDIAGNDAWAYLGNTSATLQAKMEWYDFQADISQTPVYNMEDHIIFDAREMDYSENMPIWYEANLWQGAIHGLGANMIWLFGMSDHMESGLFKNTTMQYRADCLSSTQKVGKDLMRLGYEVAAVKDRKADVGLLYSHPSRSYETFYMNSLYNSYLATQYTGVKPLFISENQTERLNEVDTLIIPEAIHVKRQVLDAVVEFVRGGGKVVMIGDSCLSMDENDCPHPTDLVKEVHDAATILESNSAKGSYVSNAESKTFDFLENIFRESGKIKVEVKDSETGARLENTEILWAEYDDSYIINLFSYEWDRVKNAVIEIDGQKVSGIYDLFELCELGDSVELQPYTAAFVKVKK